VAESDVSPDAKRDDTEAPPLAFLFGSSATPYPDDVFFFERHSKLDEFHLALHQTRIEPLPCQVRSWISTAPVVACPLADRPYCTLSGLFGDSSESAFLTYPL
jgi:hypothetical protein